MKGDDLHYEVVLDSTGRAHRVYFTDAVREELPAAAASDVALTIKRPSESDEMVAMRIDDAGESWVGRGRAVANPSATTARVAFSIRGEAYWIDLPFTPRQSAKRKPVESMPSRAAAQDGDAVAGQVAERLTNAVGPSDGHVAGDVLLAQSDVHPRIVARQVTVRRPHAPPNRPRSNARRDLGAKRIAAVLFDHTEHDPVATGLHDVVQEMRSAVAVHDDDVDPAVVIDVSKRRRAARGEER